MITGLVLGVVVVWSAVGLAAAVAIGMAIATADRNEQRSCCPHPEAEAPETVRGQFRLVLPS